MSLDCGTYSKADVTVGSSAGGILFYVSRQGTREGLCESCGELDPASKSAVVFCHSSDRSLGWIHGTRKCLSKLRWHEGAQATAPLAVALHREVAEPQGQLVVQKLAEARVGPPRCGERPPTLPVAFKFAPAWGCDLKQAWHIEELVVPPAEAQQSKRALRVHTSEEVEPSAVAAPAPPAQPSRSKKSSKVEAQELDASRPQAEQPDGGRPDDAVAEKSGDEAAGKKVETQELEAQRLEEEKPEGGRPVVVGDKSGAEAGSLDKCGSVEPVVIDEEAVCAAGA